MRIAVCEDNQLQRDMIVQLLNRCSAERSLPVTLAPYAYGINLLYDVEEGANFDIVFLDIYLPDAMGNELAHRLRAMGYQGKIVFLTASPDFAIESYDVAASGYLLLCGRYSLPGGFQKITTASLITLVCILLCPALHTSASHAIIGALMILTPGIAFTMGIRDFVHGDYLSGTIRMIDALLIAASIAIGTGLVLSLYSLLTGVVVA